MPKTRGVTVILVRRTEKSLPEKAIAVLDTPGAANVIGAITLNGEYIGAPEDYEILPYQGSFTVEK